MFQLRITCSYPFCGSEAILFSGISAYRPSVGWVAFFRFSSLVCRLSASPDVSGFGSKCCSSCKPCATTEVQRSASVHRFTPGRTSGHWLDVEFLTSSRREELTPDVLLSTMQRSIHRRSLVGRYGRVVFRSPPLVNGLWQ